MAHKQNIDVNIIKNSLCTPLPIENIEINYENVFPIPFDEKFEDNQEIVKIFNNMKILVLDMTYYHLKNNKYTKEDIMSRMLYLQKIIKYFQCSKNEKWLMNQTGLIYEMKMNWYIDDISELSCNCNLCK